MAQEKGKWLSLSPARRFICDMMANSMCIPGIPLERRMKLSSLVEARNRLAVRPGWCPIFLKAYSFVGLDVPQLRQMYMPFPWPHLYQHPLNICAVSIEREFAGETGVLVAHLRGPENQGLLEIEKHLRDFKTQPLANFAAFRRIQRLCNLPLPLRRLVWLWGMHSSGFRRARHLGTFGVSSVAGAGGSILHVLSPLATTLTYGLVDEQGEVDVRITFDHRVMDGATIARALVQMEEILLTKIREELLTLAHSQSASSTDMESPDEFSTRGLSSHAKISFQTPTNETVPDPRKMEIYLPDNSN